MATSGNPYESSRIVIRPEEVDRPQRVQGPRTQESAIQLLRVLIVVDIALVFLTIVLGMVGGAIYTAGLGDEQADEEISDALALFVLGYILIFLVAQIVAWIGLFRLSPWSRWLYLGIMVAGYLLWLPFAAFDFSPAWGLATGIADLSSVITGVILAMVFFSPAAERFVASKDGPSR